jgi:hypothetical protein
LLALACLVASCSHASDPCPDNNLVVVVNMAESVIGDELAVDVIFGELRLRHGTVKRPPGGTRGRIEVDLGKDYVPSTVLRVSVSITSNGALKGRSEVNVTLEPTCSRFEVTLTNNRPEADWSCVGLVDLTAHRTGKLLNAQFHFVDIGNNPIPPSTAYACLEFKPNCLLPEWQGTSVDGMLTVAIEEGFDGFFNTDVSKHGFYPALLDITRPMDRMKARPVTVVITPEILRALAASAKAEVLLDERGFLTMATFDCRGTRIGGVSFSYTAPAVADPQPQLYFITDNWIPVPVTILDATDDTGTAFIANLPPGAIRVTATHKESGARLAEFSTRIIAGVMTYVAVEPL